MTSSRGGAAHDPKTEHDKNDAQNQEYEEQKFGDRERSTREAAETEDGGNQTKNEKQEGKPQHAVSPIICYDFATLAATKCSSRERTDHVGPAAISTL
jgi:hypothetical protein